MAPGNARLPEHMRSSIGAYFPYARERGTFFEEFLRSIGKQDADTIIAPLGDGVFTGITAGHETMQVCVRSQRLADHLNALIRGAAP